jgi:hypothetical protein
VIFCVTVCLYCDFCLLMPGRDKFSVFVNLFHVTISHNYSETSFAYFSLVIIACMVMIYEFDNTKRAKEIYEIGDGQKLCR